MRDARRTLPPDRRCGPEIRKCVKSRIFLVFYTHFACFCVLHAHAAPLIATWRIRQVPGVSAFGSTLTYVGLRRDR